jgi:integrase
MRMGEINALRREDIDFENNIIHVRRTISRGMEYRDFLKDGTKTTSGNRDVPISSKLKPYLEAALERQQENKEDLIFYDYNKDSLISTTQVNNYYRRICEKAGIPMEGQHALRHTFATHAAASGIDPRTLAGLLGHTKPSFTLDAYTHVTTDMQKRAAGIVSNFITDTFGKELKPWELSETEMEEKYEQG